MTDDEDEGTVFLIRGRQQGKTTRLVSWLTQKPDTRVLLTVNQAEAARLMSEVRKGMEHSSETWRKQSAEEQHNWLRLHVRTFNDVSSRRGPFPEGWQIGVDNLDLLLIKFLNRPASMVTATGGVA